MIYKKYELALSLNGDQIMHIARNAIGNVVFRENSEKSLKKAIDDYIKEQQYLAELAEQKKLEKEAKKTKQESQLDIPEADLTGEEVVETEADQTLVPQKRVTRGPDGKFISKSQLDLEEEDKKKSFWDKLTS